MMRILNTVLASVSNDTEFRSVYRALNSKFREVFLSKHIRIMYFHADIHKCSSIIFFSEFQLASTVTTSIPSRSNGHSECLVLGENEFLRRFDKGRFVLEGERYDHRTKADFLDRTRCIASILDFKNGLYFIKVRRNFRDFHAKIRAQFALTHFTLKLNGAFGQMLTALCLANSPDKGKRASHTNEKLQCGKPQHHVGAVRHAELSDQVGQRDHVVKLHLNALLRVVSMVMAELCVAFEGCQQSHMSVAA